MPLRFGIYIRTTHEPIIASRSGVAEPSLKPRRSPLESNTVNQIQYTGTGVASGSKTASSSTVTVTPSTTYILSGFIVATTVTTGSPQWAVMNPALTATYGTASQ